MMDAYCSSDLGICVDGRVEETSWTFLIATLAFPASRGIEAERKITAGQPTWYALPIRVPIGLVFFMLPLPDLLPKLYIGSNEVRSHEAWSRAPGMGTRHLLSTHPRERLRASACRLELLELNKPGEKDPRQHSENDV